jgi:thymidine phosphorylase
MAARMLVLGGVVRDEEGAESAVDRAVRSGAALETFRRMVERHGGDPRIVDDLSRLPSVRDREPLPSSQAGYVTAMRAEFIGRASSALGAGRDRLTDPIDHAVGIAIHVKPGERVEVGQPLLDLHHRNGRGLAEALNLCRGAFEIGDAPPPARPKILGEVR